HLCGTCRVPARNRNKFSRLDSKLFRLGLTKVFSGDIGRRTLRDQATKTCHSSTTRDNLNPRERFFAAFNLRRRRAHTWRRLNSTPGWLSIGGGLRYA